MAMIEVFVLASDSDCVYTLRPAMRPAAARFLSSIYDCLNRLIIEPVIAVLRYFRSKQPLRPAVSKSVYAVAYVLFLQEPALRCTDTRSF
jgi:hypothetical protein